MVFVPIEPGTFVMGSPADEPKREPQERPHDVRIETAFWLGAYEVTQAEWEAVMGNNPSHFPSPSGRLPVEEINWVEVQTFLQRLTARNPGSRFRLPTEAEWEYACRAGTTTAYATGTTLGHDQANFAESTADTYAGRGSTTEVGAFPPNAWGLFDMHGNVWEWLEDEHCPYPDGPGTAGPATCGSPLKVIRGGSWYFEADSARCALRYTHPPADRGKSLGFRVARELTAPSGR